MKMDEWELEEFLRNGRIIRIASVSKEGKPHIAPIWYVYRNGKFYVKTSSKSRKVKNIKKNNAVAFSLDVGGGFSDIKAVAGSGLAKIVTNHPQAREIDDSITIKYLGSLDHPVAKELAKLDDTLIEITPTKKISWDYSK
jgi:nitroimidazol reductase NimA-like FMN-containing flavoprotein (pyridoxamine 5'-phosphate oxidase superfamily)